MLSWWRGHPAGWWNPADYNVASICVPIGTHVPHAAGLAWGKKLRGENACAIVYFGDGATSEGAFHEGANFAGVMRAPLVLFCNNNGWAISTPVSAQTAAETLADKAVGYGMPGVRVDGLDVLAVYEATREAVTRRARGEGRRSSRRSGIALRRTQRLTIREGVHRPRAGRGGAAARVRRSLRGLPAARGRPHGRDAERSRRRPRRSIRDGIAAAEAEPPADPSLLFEHPTSSDPPGRSSSDLAELPGECLGWMAELTIVEAINDCFHVELGSGRERHSHGRGRRPSRGRLPSDGRASRPVRPDRCVDTPLAEAGIMGTAVGLCMAGFRPVCEMQYDAFSYPALDQLITHVGRYRWRTGGAMAFPITVRMPYGGGVRAPELHDDSPETYYVHTPGVKVAIPSTPADAKGLLAAAIRDPDPVVIFEPKLHYRTMRGQVPDGEHVVPLGQARPCARATT